MKILLSLALFTLCTFAAQETTRPTNPLEQHAWLQQLVGEWEVSINAVMEPGAEPVIWKSRESTRSIGDLWVVAEGSMDDGGEPFTSLMTLGYDPNKKAFVGTWIDTIQPVMWSYVGHLDEAKRVLTLEAEGPHYEDPSKTAKYRDQIEVVSPDEKKLNSSMLGEDGKWTTFMTSTARRVK